MIWLHDQIIEAIHDADIMQTDHSLSPLVVHPKERQQRPLLNQVELLLRLAEEMVFLMSI